MFIAEAIFERVGGYTSDAGSVRRQIYADLRRFTALPPTPNYTGWWQMREQFARRRHVTARRPGVEPAT